MKARVYATGTRILQVLSFVLNIEFQLRQKTVWIMLTVKFQMCAVEFTECSTILLHNTFSSVCMVLIFLTCSVFYSSTFYTKSQYFGSEWFKRGVQRIIPPTAQLPPLFVTDPMALADGGTASGGRPWIYLPTGGTGLHWFAWTEPGGHEANSLLFAPDQDSVMEGWCWSRAEDPLVKDVPRGGGKDSRPWGDYTWHCHLNVKE